MQPYLFDRMNAIKEQVSYEMARCPNGAAFALIVAMGELSSLANTIESETYEQKALRRRIERLQYAVLHYLEGQGANLPPTVRNYFAPDYLDPAQHIVNGVNGLNLGAAPDPSQVALKG